jgi:glyoxylate utilization-related uncharacterized protein
VEVWLSNFCTNSVPIPAGSPVNKAMVGNVIKNTSYCVDGSINTKYRDAPLKLPTGFYAFAFSKPGARVTTAGKYNRIFFLKMGYFKYEYDNTLWARIAR